MVGFLYMLVKCPTIAVLVDHVGVKLDHLGLDEFDDVRWVEILECLYFVVDELLEIWGLSKVLHWELLHGIYFIGF